MGSHFDTFWSTNQTKNSAQKEDQKRAKKEPVAYIVGKNTSFFKLQLNRNIPYTISKNISNAVNNIYNDLKLEKNNKNTILLSPAAASFDQFSNFENRGDYFRSLIIKKFKKGIHV